MKKTLYLLFFITSVINSQEYSYGEKIITCVFDAEGKNKNEVYSAINKWISINYNSAQNVIQLNDLESGNIIIKGVNTSSYKNALKDTYPNNKYIPEYNIIKFNHTVEVNIKDNKFRVKYLLTDILDLSPSGSGVVIPKDLVFGLVDLTGLKQGKIDAYNNYIEYTWKKLWAGKNRIKKQTEATIPVFTELNKGVSLDIINTMESINQSVSKFKKDDW